jgi:hypothetical protein
LSVGVGMSVEDGELKVGEALGEQGHHPVVMVNTDNKEEPIGIGIADAENNMIAFVPMNLFMANEFGQIFAEKFNKALIKIRGDT